MKRPSELNLPNSITILRILVLPLCAYALFKNGGDDSTWRIIAWWLFFIVGLSDMVDGKLARSRNSVTEFGKLLDPIADKALIGTAMVSLSILGHMPWWMTIVILTREIGITVFRFAVINNGIIPANRGGKIKTLSQGLAVSFYILPLHSSWFWFRDLFMYIAIALTLVTGFWYILAARKE
ncbi:MAG TPA: CDP-diacylglycerol--glycerol-3-phosphate 3-phosphatidyltransferase [Candidatus Nanopelagicaceae bacterium]